MAPEEHVVAHVNSPRLKLRGKLRGGFAELPVGPPCYVVATPVDVRDISTVARKLFQVFQERPTRGFRGGFHGFRHSSCATFALKNQWPLWRAICNPAASRRAVSSNFTRR